MLLRALLLLLFGRGMEGEPCHASCSICASCDKDMLPLRSGSVSCSGYFQGFSGNVQEFYVLINQES
jgi:hypothetical protein